MTTTSVSAELKEVLNSVQSALNGISLEYTIKNRADGPFLLFELAEPQERFFRAVRKALATLSEDNPFRDRTTIVRRSKAPSDRLSLPEAQLLRAAISESLTIDRYSFESDFFSRYTSSVTNFENQIITNANFVVYGRRGSGKSSLLSYALHMLQRHELPFAWIAMQVHAGRSDSRLAVDVIGELMTQLREYSRDLGTYHVAQTELEQLERVQESDFPRALKRSLPKFQKAIASATGANRIATIFLDDFHVIAETIQADVLAVLYSITRGNRTYLKVSGIEQLCRPWDGHRHVGLQPNHDAQILRLDHNLTMPDRSKRHIVGILDAQARYCALPDIQYLTGDRALSRLVWVAAAVPRDALSLFALAISKGIAKGEKRVSVTSINAAASESSEAKLKDIDQDATGQKERVNETLEQITQFCIQNQRTNAFLLEIRNSHPVFQDIQRLIALRFIHVLHEGTTPHRAGTRFVALMLDYGFYVGIRAARSVELFQKEPATILAKDLRNLPVFPLAL